MSEDPQYMQPPPGDGNMPSPPDLPPIGSDSEIRSAKYLPQGQGYAPLQSAPPHPHDAYARSLPQNQPAYYQPGFGQPRYTGAPPPPGYGPQFFQQKPQSGKAIASMILGIANFVFLIAAPIAAPIGLILGFIALKDTRPEGSLQGRGFAVAGLVINSIALLGCVAMGLGIAALVYAEKTHKTERRQASVTSDFDTIRARLHRYYSLNKGSLGPGGPVLTEYASDREIVKGALKLNDLVTDGDLSGNVSDFDLSITSKAGAHVVHRASGRELVITDIKQDLFVITPGH